MQEQDLADFQAFLLETLSAHDTPKKILAELCSQPLDQGLASYLHTLDPNMVDVAATLVKKWGQRRL